MRRGAETGPRVIFRKLRYGTSFLLWLDSIEMIIATPFQLNSALKA